MRHYSRDFTAVPVPTLMIWYYVDHEHEWTAENIA